MTIVLGANQYGKAENRLVRVYRDTARHEIRDLNVSSSLRGDFSDAHITGDQAAILPTDTQKNTVFAFAKEKGVRSIEEFALTLGDHFIGQTPKATGARIEIEEYFWDRISIDGAPHDHSFVRNGGETRTTVVTVEGRGADRKAWAVSGLKDLTLAKTTGSEFWGFLKDEYTTLQETTDRILATSLIARWRYDTFDVDFDKSYEQIRAMLLKRFAEVHSYALQQTLYAMGESVLQEIPGGRRDPVQGPEQAPLPGRPVAVRRREPGRGVLGGGPAVRPDRGGRAARRRVRSGFCLEHRPRILLRLVLDAARRLRRRATYHSPVRRIL